MLKTAFNNNQSILDIVKLKELKLRLTKPYDADNDDGDDDDDDDDNYDAMMMMMTLKV